MSRALPLMLAAVITTGTAGAALLPAEPTAVTAGVTDLAVTPIVPLDASDLAGAGLLAARAAALQKAAAARATQAAAARATQAAAVRAAAEARAARLAEAQRRASRTRRASVSYGSPRAIAQAMVAERGWSSSQFSCLDSLWQKESGWRTYASNPSGAYGIPQALPGSKMATAGSDWRTNPATQIRWGLGYISGRYGTPCAAWSQSRSTGWY